MKRRRYMQNFHYASFGCFWLIGHSSSTAERWTKNVHNPRPDLSGDNGWPTKLEKRTRWWDLCMFNAPPSALLVALPSLKLVHLLSCHHHQPQYWAVKRTEVWQPDAITWTGAANLSPLVVKTCFQVGREGGGGMSAEGGWASTLTLISWNKRSSELMPTSSIIEKGIFGRSRWRGKCRRLERFRHKLQTLQDASHTTGCWTCNRIVLIAMKLSSPPLIDHGRFRYSNRLKRLCQVHSIPSVPFIRRTERPSRSRSRSSRRP